MTTPIGPYMNEDGNWWVPVDAASFRQARQGDHSLPPILDPRRGHTALRGQGDDVARQRARGRLRTGLPVTALRARMALHGKPEVVGDPIVLSASSVTTYMRCHYQWYLSEIMRLPAAPNIAMALGTAVHAGIERLLKGSPLRPVDAYTESFAKEMKKVEEPDEDPAVALRDGLLMLATYTTEVHPRFRPTLVEAKFVVELSSVPGVWWTGVIDAADDDDAHDTKTTAGKTINGRKPSFDPLKYQLQMTGYRPGYKALTGRWPKRLILDVLTRTGKYREHEIEPDTGGLLDVIRLTRNGILDRNYEPTGVLSGSCYHCPYRNVCEFSNAGGNT